MRIELIHTDALKKAIKDRDDNHHQFAWLSNKDFSVPFSRTVLNGIEDQQKENFPACCGFHQQIVTNAMDYMERFPNCCAKHKRLNSATWFKKNDYHGLPEKILETYRQTENIIKAKINEDNWYEHITEFLEYAVESFGQLPEGYGAPVAVNVYMSHVKQGLKIMKGPKARPNKLLAYLKGFESSVGEVKVTDLNDLVDRYQKWMTIFPWEISFFSSLKVYFDTQLPIISGTPAYNRYSGISKAKLVSVEQLGTFLMETTKTILKTINTRMLHAGGQLKDPDKKAIELINAQRNQELAQLGENIRDERQRYFRLFKQWFNGEIRYLEKIMPHLQKMDTHHSEVNTPTEVKNDKIDITKQKNKFCHHMPIQVAIDHFSKLVTHLSGNGKSFLNQQQLEDFVLAAFALVEGKPKQRINYQRGESGIVRGLFYDFYNLAVREYESSLQCKYKYVNLLCEYFEGWEHKKVATNFRTAGGPWK